MRNITATHASYLSTLLRQTELLCMLLQEAEKFHVHFPFAERGHVVQEATVKQHEASTKVQLTKLVMAVPSLHHSAACFLITNVQKVHLKLVYILILCLSE